MFIGQQFLQNVLGYDTLEAGAAILPAVILMVIVAPRSAKLIEARGSRFTLLFGYVFCFLGFLTMLTLWDDRQPVLAGRARVRLRRNRRGTRGHAGVALAHRFGAGAARGDGVGAPPTSSATSAGRSCSRSSGALLTAGYAAAFTKLIAGSSERQQREHQRPVAAHEVVLERGEHRRAVSAVLEADHRRRADVVPRRRRLGLRRRARSRSSSARRSCSSCSRSTTASSSCSTGTTRKTPTTMPSPRDRAPRVSWIRDTDERARRRPADIALLVVSALLALLVGFWAQTQSSVNVNLFRTLNDLSGNMVGLAKGVYALGSIWAVLAVTAGAPGPAPVPGRRVRGASPAPARGASSLLLNDAARHPHDQRARRRRAHRRRSGVPGRERGRDHRPRLRHRTVHRAAAATHPRRRHPAGLRGRDVPRRRFPGRRHRRRARRLRQSPRSVRVVFGRTGGQPSVAEVRAALTDLGYDVVTIATRDRAHPARWPSWTSSSPPASTCGSTRSDATSATPASPPRRGTRRCTTTPASRCSAVGSSRSSTSPTP